MEKMHYMLSAIVLSLDQMFTNSTCFVHQSFGGYFVAENAKGKLKHAKCILVLRQQNSLHMFVKLPPYSFY